MIVSRSTSNLFCQTEKANEIFRKSAFSLVNALKLISLQVPLLKSILILTTLQKEINLQK